ncbi:hypothetical protein QL996_02490 [Planococcus sp. APC 4015]|nr:hypothetical protein [Planococcus sp. APC 4015]
MEPLDVFGSVVLPAAAILISAAIAVWLARSERRASERSHTRAAVVGLVTALTDLERTAAAGDTDAARAASVEFSTSLNALLAYLPRKDVAVPRYLAIVMNRAIETGDAGAISRTALFLTNCLDEWLRGAVSSEQFARSAPPDVNGVFEDAVDPADWKSAVDG